MKARLASPLLAAILSLPLLVSAQDKPKPPAKKPLGAIAQPPTHGLALKDGDRFIFIGDSITHQCLYTQYTENFFYTRYPNLRLHFRNAGVSGDRAQDALNRFDEDIAEFKPTIATILLGMNDASYKDFDMPTYETYAKGMTALLDKLDAIKCKVIIMSPTMFDHQAFEQMVAKDPAKGKNKTPTNYNGVLAYYGKWLQEVARQRGYQFVDLFGPLNTLTVEQRKMDKNFTLIPDAIHPQADGHLVMSYSLLQQTGRNRVQFFTAPQVQSQRGRPVEIPRACHRDRRERRTRQERDLHRQIPRVALGRIRRRTHRHQADPLRPHRLPGIPDCRGTASRPLRSEAQ